MLTIVLVVAWLAVSFGFVLGLAWAAAHEQRTPSTESAAPFADPDQQTPWSATGQLAAAAEYKRAQTLGEEIGDVMVDNPQLSFQQARAIVLRRHAARPA